MNKAVLILHAALEAIFNANKVYIYGARENAFSENLKPCWKKYRNVCCDERIEADTGEHSMLLRLSENSTMQFFDIAHNLAMQIMKIESPRSNFRKMHFPVLMGTELLTKINSAGYCALKFQDHQSLKQ
jgi:hypothetical protein